MKNRAINPQATTVWSNEAQNSLNAKYVKHSLSMFAAPVTSEML
jgi:hypothetical protein